MKEVNSNGILKLEADVGPISDLEKATDLALGEMDRGPLRPILENSRKLENQQPPGRQDLKQRTTKRATEAVIAPVLPHTANGDRAISGESTQFQRNDLSPHKTAQSEDIT